MLFKGKQSGIFRKFTMDVDPGYRYIEKFMGGVPWSMIESKRFVSSKNFKLKKKTESLYLLMVKAII